MFALWRFVVKLLSWIQPLPSPLALNYFLSLLLLLLLLPSRKNIMPLVNIQVASSVRKRVGCQHRLTVAILFHFEGDEWMGGWKKERDNLPSLALCLLRIERGLSFAALISTEIRSIMVKYFRRILFEFFPTIKSSL